jgi:hypothetical protein
VKKPDLSTLADEQLVNRFAEIAIAQDRALLESRTAKFRKLYREMDAVDNELRGRGADARLGLLALYEHPNAQVRLKAAVRTLGVAPVDARRVLEMIEASGEQPQALDAGMSLWNLDQGVFKPT